jgi:hypothetical protein
MKLKTPAADNVHPIRAAAVSLVWSCVLVSGCATISTDYGKTKGTSGYKSLNGFGALRTSYEKSGFRSRDVSRLSDRVMRTDVIVWTPQVLGSVTPQVTRWFERWLSRGSKTLVYIVPDSGSEADYWIEAAKLAPPEQRLEYRKRAAKSINERMRWRLNRRQVQSNGWFRIETLVQRERLGEVSGPWQKELKKLPASLSKPSVEFAVSAFDEDKNTATAVANANAGFVINGPTGPGTPQWSMPTETSPTKTPINFSTLVETGAGNPIVAEVGSDKWKDSKIIVVAGGSLLTNYAFTRPFSRRLAAKIVAESTPAGDQDLRAGFLTSNWNQIPVSETKPGAPVASGMELLTVWPISLVTMHGVMLGLVICLMLLPIFGRPKRIRRSSQSDFGDHLDAVAALMNKAGGERYARARISEYMKRMHGETAGVWVLPDPPANTTEIPIPPLTSKRLANIVGSSNQEGTADEPTPPPVEPTDSSLHQNEDSENDSENHEADR